MFCRRAATLTKRARKELEELKEQHRALTERLVANYRARRSYDRIMDDSPARAATVSERLGAGAPGMERPGVGLIACYLHSGLRPQAVAP
jgi:hypothetical protein